MVALSTVIDVNRTSNSLSRDRNTKGDANIEAWIQFAASPLLQGCVDIKSVQSRCTVAAGIIGKYQAFF